MTIKVIEAQLASFFPREIDAMFRHRKETFVDRLGWVVAGQDGRERDVFDDANPLYLVSVDEQGDYRGSCRLLPTTGPNMLRDVFPFMIDNEMIESSTIWECSRICGEPGTLIELITAMGEIGVRTGLTQIIAVFDSRMLRVLRATRVPFDEMVKPKWVGRAPLHLGAFDIDADVLAALHEKQRVTSVLADARESCL